MTINAPAGEKSWDYPQWSNCPGYAVSIARGKSDQAHSLYLINLETNRCEPIIEGIELQQPYLWASMNPSNFSLDSIGRYGEPLNSPYQAQLGGKLLLFWQRCDSLEAAILGSSQAAQGIDPSIISGMKSFNFAVVGGDFLGQKNMILNYFLIHCPRLKVICSSLDVGRLGYADGDFSWENGVGQSYGYYYDSTHDFWKNGVPSDFKAIMRVLPTPYYWDTLQLGFLGPTPCRGWGDSLPPCNVAQTWNIRDSSAIKNIETIAVIADSLRRNGVHWIVIDFPISPHYKNTPCYSLDGPLWQTALDVQQKITDIEKANPFFHFYNANMNGNHDYSDDDALDMNHLCTEGAKRFTVRVDSLIHAVIGK